MDENGDIFDQWMNEDIDRWIHSDIYLKIDYIHLYILVYYQCIPNLLSLLFLGGYKILIVGYKMTKKLPAL